jgi:hypothetical protein
MSRKKLGRTNYREADLEVDFGREGYYGAGHFSAAYGLTIMKQTWRGVL